MAEPPPDHVPEVGSGLVDSLSVIICTNRSKHWLEAAHSVLANPQAFELIVVIQGAAGAQRELTQIVDARLRIVMDSGMGLSRARNIGIRASKGDLILFTDDDCVVAPDWVAAHVACYRDSPSAALVFGLVEAPPWYTGADGTVPTFDPLAAKGTPRNSRGIVLGMGANMSLRRACLEQVGLFDESLGVGGPLRSGEDSELSLRLSGAGLLVIADRRPVVVHEGGLRRYGPEARQQWWRDGVGVGAVGAKRLRAGDLHGAAAVLTSFNTLYLHAARALAAGRRPVGLRAAATMSVAALQGFVRGFLAWS